MASLAADVFAVFGLVVFVARLVFAFLEFVFTAVIVPPNGEPLCKDTVLHRLRAAMDGEGIESGPYQHGFHIFRHSAATMLYDLVGNMELVQSAMRHADKATTSIYVHSNQPVIEGAELLTEAILGDAEDFCDLTVTQASQTIN